MAPTVVSVFPNFAACANTPGRVPQQDDFGVARSLPTEFFFAPLCDILESALRRDDDREHALRNNQELLFNCWREALAVPECLEVEEFSDAIELD